jgi:hypothetical protein
MEYKILEDASVEGLSEKVNTMLMLEKRVSSVAMANLGWRPMGGLVVVVNPVKSSRFVQAMIKDD